MSNVLKYATKRRVKLNWFLVFFGYISPWLQIKCNVQSDTKWKINTKSAQCEGYTWIVFTFRCDPHIFTILLLLPPLFPLFVVTSVTRTDVLQNAREVLLVINKGCTFGARFATRCFLFFLLAFSCFQYFVMDLVQNEPVPALKGSFKWSLNTNNKVCSAICFYGGHF